MVTNTVYNEDNLLLMDSLPKKSIDLIYVDPPFNTGRKDFGYNDSFESTEAFVYWLQFRIAKMYGLIKDTGVLCVHLDYRTVHYVKVALDRIFGEKNFINEIIWKRNFFYNNVGNNIPRNHDTVLVYSKGKKYIYNSQYKKTKEYIKMFSHDDRDGKGKYQLTNLRGANIDRMKKENRLVKQKSGNLRLKLYLNKSKGIALDSVWSDIGGMGHNLRENVKYKTQKPLLLLKRIIKAFTNEGDLVADFFCGSGTTLVAAKQLGRKYLGCDISKKAVGITEERLKNANTN